MKDIDFDELDKAVASLMGTVQDTRPQSDVPPAKTLTISGTLKPGENPMYTKLGEVAKGIGDETLVGEGERTTVNELDAGQQATPSAPVAAETPQPPAAESLQPTVAEPAVATPPAVSAPSQPPVKRPNSGRFMDVVHPSSDMHTTDNVPRLVVPERGGATPTTPPSAPVATGPAQPIVKESAAPAMPAVASANPEAPLTPFLADAKVEKRPLGGGTLSGPVASPFGHESVQENKEESAQAKTDELSSEQQVLDASELTPKQTPEEEKLQAIESQGTAEVPAEVIDPVAGESVRAVESGDTESLSTGLAAATDPSKSVEDSSTHDKSSSRQALDHPAKQKSGWGTVIIIVVIIIVFAALGAAAYFFLMGSA